MTQVRGTNQSLYMNTKKAMPKSMPKPKPMPMKGGKRGC